MLSLRVKLTLYYLAILTAVLLLFGFSIYAYISRSLLMTIDEALDYQVKRIERNMAVSVSSELTEPLPLIDEDLDQLLQISPQITQVIDDYGRITDEMAAAEGYHLDVDLEQLKTLEVGRTYFDTIKMRSGQDLRVAVRRVIDLEGGGTYYLRLGQSLGSIENARRRLLLILGLGVPLALLMGSYGGLLLANQALRPVDRITRAAEQIGAGDLSERVPTTSKMDEIGRLAATFNKMISRLQAAFERQKQFTSDASHELRTPLAVMRGDIELTLRRERSTEEYTRVLTSNLEEIVRLSHLVEDLLMLARADSGRVELNPEPLDINLLCREMVEYITPLVLQRHQAINFDGDDKEVIIHADKHRIKQMLLNLLDNAVKYTDEKGIITVGLRSEASNVKITVSDTGRGIPSDDLPFIFDRFFRRSKPDRTASGFGLGLSIVKWIVDTHGGRIEASSRPGEGTTFMVSLPLNQAKTG
ncbi:MAG: HAMP domain-containing protein [Acidobacteriota bacterium]|nr:MAG: HAMP domain-containing protein [Acidobacteriota bacterium]